MAKTSTKTDAEKAADAAKKVETFKRLASNRLTNAKKQISLIGNLAAYKPTDTQKAFILSELGKACAAVEAAFQGKASAAEIVIPD